jgi:hypothetical protein
MYLVRRIQSCITLLASIIPSYKTYMIVLVDNSPLTDDDDSKLLNKSLTLTMYFIPSST